MGTVSGQGWGWGRDVFAVGRGAAGFGYSAGPPRTSLWGAPGPLSFCPGSLRLCVRWATVATTLMLQGQF